MVKTRKFIKFERDIIIGLRKSKKSIRKIKNLTGYSRNAIFNIINNYEKKGITKPLPRSDKPLKLSQKNKKQLIQFVKTNKRYNIKYLNPTIKNSNSIMI